MQDTELFLSLAEIAGVFVGFGALIAIRSGGPSDPVDVAYVGMVVWMGIQVVTASLLPVAISRFDVPSHAVWLSCSLIVLALFFIGDAVVLRLSRERKALLAATPTKTRAKLELAAVPLWLPANIALVLIVLGVLPDLGRRHMPSSPGRSLSGRCTAPSGSKRCSRCTAWSSRPSGRTTGRMT